jgi:transposase InsO family protein
LATVIDCSTKAVVGWAMDDNYKAPLIEKAIATAAGNHQFADDAIFHSDRGSNDTSNQFIRTLKKHGPRHSVGRTGICYEHIAEHEGGGQRDGRNVLRSVEE